MGISILFLIPKVRRRIMWIRMFLHFILRREVQSLYFCRSKFGRWMVMDGNSYDVRIAPSSNNTDGWLCLIQYIKETEGGDVG